MEKREYNGWKNRATWNVMLWLQNDEGLYRTYRTYCKMVQDGKGSIVEAREEMLLLCFPSGKTPDGDSVHSASRTEINAAMKEEVS